MIIRRFFSTKKQYDVTIVGGGPGGYVAAIKAAQLGLRTACVEKRGSLGGTCLNVGCIPSKALLKNAELAHVLAHEKDKFGIEGDATMAFGPTHKRSRQVSAGIVKGVHFLMKKNKITVHMGTGTMTGPTTMTVKSDKGEEQLSAKHVILALGARARHLDALRQDEAEVNAACGLPPSNPELIAEHLRRAQQALEAITGRYTADDLLGRIFATFCLGK